MQAKDTFFMNFKSAIKKHLIIQVILFLLLISLDQLSKVLLAGSLQAKGDVTLIPGVLDLHYLENTGAAFGIFRDRQWLFFILTAVILGVVAYLFVRLYKGLFGYTGSNPGTVKRSVWLGYGLAVLSAGAVGNLIDRIAHGYVIDFICVRFVDFPVFNLADIYVTISCIFIVVFFIFIYRKDEEFKIL